jgi:branched-chain amino acid transport system permease protein
MTMIYKLRRKMNQNEKLSSAVATALAAEHSTTYVQSVDTAASGRDEWVAQVDNRRTVRHGFVGRIVDAWAALPLVLRHALILAPALFFPLLAGSEPLLAAFGLGDGGFILRTAVRFFTFAILASGLTVVVGYAGLLDLGYIAFMGLAGYLYAYMSSDFLQSAGITPYGLAVPSLISIPLIVAVVAAIGYCIGAISIRLSGDYLTIVTLSFGQLFVQLALTMTRVYIPGRARPLDFTRGPNGINNLDNIHLFGYEIASTVQYYYLFLVLLVGILWMVSHLNRSSIGRSWRAIREDELAAEVMGIPAWRLKVLAFAIGAAIAALAGSLDAAFQGNVVPSPRYSTPTLVNLYAMVVLGGVGSLPGAVTGALILVVVPEMLRDVTLAGYLFYGALIAGLAATMRPWSHLLKLLGGTLLGGYVVKVAVNAWLPQLDAGYPPVGSLLNGIVQSWLVIPANYVTAGNVVTAAAILLLLGTILLRSHQLWHNFFAGVSLYAFAFAWETTLAANPAATRLLVVGLTLVIVMIVRPQGLLGKAEVKVV